MRPVSKTTRVQVGAPSSATDIASGVEAALATKITVPSPSTTQTCRVIGLARSSLQYVPSRRDDDELRLAIIRLAKQYGRYGYRKITELLHVERWTVNYKKVERLWREEALQLPHRHKRRKRLYHKDGSIIRLRPMHANHVWAIHCPSGGCKAIC